MYNILYKLYIGDWGLGIGDWGLGIGPNPPSPIPNTQVFYSNPRERKIFKAKKINNGNVAFQFDYAE